MIEIIYYQLVPSDMKLVVCEHLDPDISAEPYKADLEEAVKTEKPTGLVQLVNIEDDPLQRLTINVYYRLYRIRRKLSQ